MNDLAGLIIVAWAAFSLIICNRQLSALKKNNEDLKEIKTILMSRGRE